MTVERIGHSGAYVVSGMVRGYLVTRTFYGYTRREAVSLWRAETRKA